MSPAVSNLAVALAALDAEVVVWRDGKESKLTIGKLYEDAWKNPSVHNSLRPSDLILAVRGTDPGGQERLFANEREERDFDWALVSCAVSGKVTDGKISGARIVLGAVAPVPFVVEKANQFLEGKVLDDKSATAAADLVLQEAMPLAQNGYKVPIARALIRRALARLNA